MIFDPKEMADTVERFSKALRTAPTRRFDESAESFAQRCQIWHGQHAEAVEDAENTVWIDEIQNILREHRTYSDKR